jgi:hypothetical protein
MMVDDKLVIHFDARLEVENLGKPQNFVIICE